MHIDLAVFPILKAIGRRCVRTIISRSLPAALALCRVCVASPAYPAAISIRLVVVLCAAFVATAAEAVSPPHVVVVLTDDQDVASLASMPQVKRLLAKDGVTFANSFVDFPLCCPSRSSLLTGLSSRTTGIDENGSGGRGGWPAFRTLEPEALPCWLQARGYRTAWVGKYLNLYDGTTVPPCWTHWHAMATVGYFNWTMNHNGTPVAYGQAPQAYSTDVIARIARDVIDAEIRSGAPLFLVLAPYAPHDPATPAPRHAWTWAFKWPAALVNKPSFNERDLSDKPTYMQPRGMFDFNRLLSTVKLWQRRQETLQAVDDAVAMLVGRLGSHAALGQTYIVYTSDNGFLQGEHRIYAAKRLVYEESIRVPLIIRGPGVPRGEARTQLVNNLDVAATIVEWADATPPWPLDGRSLVPVLATTTAPWRTGLRVVGQSGDPILGPPLWGTFVAVRTLTAILAEHTSNDGTRRELEFYDLVRDPYQLVNRPDAPPVAGLRDLLRHLEDCTGGACWVPE